MSRDLRLPGPLATLMGNSRPDEIGTLADGRLANADAICVTQTPPFGPEIVDILKVHVRK